MDKKHYFRTKWYFEHLLTESEFTYYKDHAKTWSDFVENEMKTKPWPEASLNIYNYLEQVAPNIFNKLFGVCYADWVINAFESPLSRDEYAYNKYNQHNIATLNGEWDDKSAEENLSPIFFVRNGLNMDFVQADEKKEWLVYIQAQEKDYKNVIVRFFDWIQSVPTIETFNARLRDDYAHKVDLGGVMSNGLVIAYKKGIYPKQIAYVEKQIDDYIAYQNTHLING